MSVRSKGDLRRAADTREPIRPSRIAPAALLLLAALLALFVLLRAAFEKAPRRITRERQPVVDVPELETAAVSWPQAPAAGVVVPPVDTAQTTKNLLRDRSPDCLACAEYNSCLDATREGGNCDDLTTSAPGCGPGVTERDVCYGVLRDVFTSECAVSLQETPCLCGTTDVMECLNGTTTPNGPIFQEYACDFRTADVGLIYRDFKEASYGAGRANSLIQCLAAFECRCFTQAPRNEAR
jgi:hypothetical protein